MRRLGCCLLLVLFRVDLAMAAEPVDTGSANPATAAPAVPADSTKQTSYLVITLERGESFTAFKVGPGGPDYVRVTRPDGRRERIPANRIRSVVGSDGTNWTHTVLDRRRSVGNDEGLPSDPTPHAGFRGRPLPERRTFPITQLGIGARVDAGSPLYTKKDGYVFTDLGVMRNVSRHVAVGGTFYAGGDDHRLRVGPKARVRYWLSREVSVDLAPGMLLWGVDDWHGGARFPGFVGEASLSIEDIVVLTAQMESIHIEDAHGAEDQDTSVYLGGKIGGVPGLVGLFVGLFAVAVISAGLNGVHAL